MQGAHAMEVLPSGGQVLARCDGVVINREDVPPMVSALDVLCRYSALPPETRFDEEEEEEDRNDSTAAFGENKHDRRGVPNTIANISSTTCGNYEHTRVRRLSLGCKGLDAALEGGIQRTALTEVCGEAGCGKTQLVLGCLLASLLVEDMAYTWKYGRCVYICTEGNAPSERLEQMARELCKGRRCLCTSCSSTNNLKLDLLEPGDLLDRVLIREVQTSQELQAVLSRDLPALLEALNFRSSSNSSSSNSSSSNNNKMIREPVRLVVVDSIAALFRAEFENTMQSLAERNALLIKFSQIMRDLGDQFDCCFVVVNQVSANFIAKRGNGDRSALKAALGLSWSNCINARIMLSRIHGASMANKNNEVEPRNLRVVFSPVHPDVETTFVITKGGISACD